MPRFKVGDTVWFAKCNWESVQKICPICFGKKVVTLILGNEDHVILPCRGCAPGFESPKGYITEYEYVVGPEIVVISGMTVEMNYDKEVVSYRSCHGLYNDKDLYVTEEEARVRANEKKAQLDIDQTTRAEYIKKDVQKGFSWNAHYHMGHAKKDRESALRHDEQAKLCKERIKES